MEKIKSSEIRTDEEILERIGGKKILLNNVLRRKENCIGSILRINCLSHDAIDGQMTEVKLVGKRRTHFVNDLRNRKRFWEVK